MVVLSITQWNPALCLCGHYFSPWGYSSIKAHRLFLLYTSHTCCHTLLLEGILLQYRSHAWGEKMDRYVCPYACINIFQWLSLSHFKDGLPHVSLMQPPYKSLQYSILLKISLGTRIREAAWNRFRLLPSDKCPVYGQNVCCITAMLKTQRCPYLMVLFSLKFCFESLFLFQCDEIILHVPVIFFF